MSELKLCKDCRGFVDCSYIPYIQVSAACALAGEIDVVHGGRLWCDPRQARQAGFPCGPDALLWEPKPQEPERPRRWWQVWRRK